MINQNIDGSRSLEKNRDVFGSGGGGGGDYGGEVIAGVGIDTGTRRIHSKQSDE